MPGFSLTTAIAIAGLISILICSFLFALSRHQHSKQAADSYVFLAIAYGFNGLRLACQLSAIYDIPLTSIGGDLFYICFISAFWLGIRVYSQPKVLPPLQWLIPCVLIAWIASARIATIPFPWAPLPQHLIGAVVLALSGRQMWRLNKAKPHHGFGVLSVMMYIQGASTLSYPFTRFTWYAPYGFGLFAFLASAIGMGLMISALRNDQTELLTEMAARKKAEEAQKHSLFFIETLLANSPAATVVMDGATKTCIHLNPAAAKIFGSTVALLLGRDFGEIALWQEAGFDKLAESVLADGIMRHGEKTVTTGVSMEIILDCFLSRFEIDGKGLLMFVAVDISEKKRLEEENRKIEEQMLHVQKLESLGVLAGGIAHDFNNILLAVVGNADLALMRLAPESPARHNIQQIEVAAGRASELVRQMLAYSGKGRFVIEDLDLTALVQEMAHMLEVSISKKAVLRYNFAQGLPSIRCDATQLRQVVMNLVINASEAIGDRSGIIAISTGAMQCDSSYLAETWINDNLPAGFYVYVEIADTGCGIEREVIAKIFDPFFTTKFTGRGLGMAAVLGIVRSHSGAIKVYSEVGKGTTFRVLLPAIGRAADRQRALSEMEEIWRGCGTLLLVDDEETIRAVGKEMLQEIGFNVLTAEDGREAVRIFAEHRDEIVCVLLDLTMPHMDGVQTFRELRRIKPDVPIIMASGYSEQEVTQQFVGKGLTGYIQKPFKIKEMSAKLRETLQGGDSRKET